MFKSNLIGNDLVMPSKDAFLSLCWADMSTNDLGSKIQRISDISNTLDSNLLSLVQGASIYIDKLAPCTKKIQEDLDI